MSKQREAVRRWRAKTKQRMIDSMGGKCACCGYDRCVEALEFHHLDPSKKDLAFGSIRANPASWMKIVEELRKCILVCAICHREIHYGIREIPSEFPRFNETYADYKADDFHQMTRCPVCGKQKPEKNRSCSSKCAGSLAGVDVKWNQIDLLSILTTMTIVEAAESLGVSGAAVAKRLQRLGRSTKHPYDLI